jgi:hypothetical protein
VTRQRLFALLDEAETVYASVRISEHSGGFDVPVDREEVKGRLADDPAWWDEAVDYLASWDAEDRSLFVGCRPGPGED